MQLPKTNKDWPLEHAKKVKDGRWKCKKTGTIIQCLTTGRSIWTKPFSGGSGAVRQIGHLHCPECQPNFELPEYGTSIYSDELVKAF